MNRDHPSTYIAPSIAEAIRNYSAEAEKLKRPHPVQLALIQSEQWFRLFVPKVYNGLQLNLPEALRLEEALAWTDGSVGWSVTLCAGAGWFGGFIDPKIAAQIFDNDAVCLAGSGNPSGIARKMDGHYVVTGQWAYATGASDATCFTANCVIEENGILLKHAGGKDLVRSFLFLKEEVTVHENWKTIGMIATGSNSFSVNELTINRDRIFQIEANSKTLTLPLYSYPFLQFAETTLAVNSSGMAIRFLELCEIIFQQKPIRSSDHAFRNAAKKLDNTRDEFYKQVENSWSECVDHLCISSPALRQISRHSRRLAHTSLEIVDKLYPLCGMQAANPSTEINRVWRNLHTGSQHSLFNKKD